MKKSLFILIMLMLFTNSCSEKETISEFAIHLRSEPTVIATNEEILNMVRELGLNYPGTIVTDGSVASDIQGDIVHRYENISIGEDAVVVDRATALMWEQKGSELYNWEEAQNYVSMLNEKNYAECSEWRVPTLEELLSLLEPERVNGEFFIDPVFQMGEIPYYYWSSDLKISGQNWVVTYYFGQAYDGYGNHYDGYVRAVCSMDGQD